jgi:hypothetical protein
MANLVMPRVQAMVLCDGVKESDDEPDVFQLAGVRTVLDAASFPALHPRLCVFLQMSGHRGQASCHVEIERGKTGEVVIETPNRSVNFENPTSAVPLIFRVRNCVFPEPGVYYVQVYQDRKLIGERTLQVRQED